MRVYLRLAVFAAVALHMNLGPFVEQVLQRRRPPTTMSWRMYSGVGRDLCETRWFRVDGGAREPVDRLATLGYSPWTAAPDRVKLLHGPREVRKAATELCARLPGSDIRVEARCGSYPNGAWTRPIEPDEALCESGARPSAGAPVRERGKRGKRR